MIRSLLLRLQLLCLLAFCACCTSPALAAAPATAPTLASQAAQLPLDDGLHARFDVALGQVEGKLVRLVAAAPLLLVALAIVLLSMWIGRGLSRRRGWLRLRSGNPYMEDLIRRIVRLLALLVGVLVALDLLGATSLVGAVLGSAGVIGLVLGFAFKDIAENYVAGVLLSLRRPFSPGDHVVIDSHEGKVVALDSRTTTLMTMDGNQLRLPNALVFKAVVLNYSTNPQRRFDFNVLIDNADSIRRAQALGLQVIEGIHGVLAEPAPSSLVKDYTPAGVTLAFYGWIDQTASDLGKVRSEAIRLVKSAYTREEMHAPKAISHVVLARTEHPALPAPPAHAENGRADTSVNRDMDQQLAAAQQASDQNLLDGEKSKPAAG